MSPRSRSSKKSKGLYQKLEADHIFFLASGLAFNFFTCFIPLLLVILSGLGFFLHSSQEMLEHVRTYIQKMLPYASPRITANIFNVIKDRKWVGIIGFLGLLWTATRLFSSIRTVLDLTLENRAKHGYLREKLHDLWMVFITGLLFLASTLFSGLLDIIKTFPDRLGLSVIFSLRWWGGLIGFSGGYLLSILMFLVLFRFLPTQKPKSSTAIKISLLIGTFWEIAKYLFRLYVNLINNFTAIYGSLGLLVIFLLWVYYSSLIFVLGGELIWYSERRRRG
jgi:membrane protein